MYCKYNILNGVIFRDFRTFEIRILEIRFDLPFAIKNWDLHGDI